MNYEELIKMSVKDLKARLKELNLQAKDAKGDVLDTLIDEAEIIDGILKDVQNRQKLGRLAAETNVSDELVASEGGEGTIEPKVKAKEDRGKAIKDGKNVKFSAGKVTRDLKSQLSSKNTVLPTHSADDINETFNNVSSLVDRVKNIHLEGGETYQRGFVKTYGDGAAATEENGDYNPSEPTFGYVTIKKEKITAYTEEPEEMVKLPNADYDSIVESSVTKSIRRYLSRQILIGDGSTSKFKGIFHNPSSSQEQVIDPATDIEISEINEATLDEIIYSYGGDEEVEDVAVLILNKKDLKAFAKLRDKQGRKIYTIVNHGNTGTIDGVPYVINSACKAVSDTGTSVGGYVMAYGPLQNYEMAIFSDIDARKSTEYKFKQGQIAYRADIFAGGAVAAYNGFVRVKKGNA